MSEAGTAIPADATGGFPRPAGRSRLALCLGVICVAIVVWAAIYAPVRRFEFLNFDDDMFLSNNPWLKRGLTWESLKWAFEANLSTSTFSTHAEYWSPITLLSRLVDAEIYGLDAGAHHLTSAIVHLANAALLWAALFRLTGARRRSAAVAFLFLVHPLNVEPVCWLSARKDLLGATFSFLTLLAYAHFARLPSLRRYLVLLLAFCAALMAKPMSVTLPFLLLLLDWWPLGRWKRLAGTGSSRILLLLEKAPLFALAVFGAKLAIVSQRNWGAMPSADEYPPIVRVENALVSYVVYLRRVFWPSDLAIYYPHPGHSLSAWCGIAALLFLGVLSAAALLARPRAPYLLAGWIWFGLVLGPVIGLVQIGNQAMADRYAYPSVIGIFVLLVWAAGDLLRERPRIAAGAAAIAIAALSVSSARQVLTWRDSETVFTRALAVTRDNDVAHLNLGNVYFMRGDYRAAREHYRRSIDIRPKQFRVLNNLGAVEAALGEPEEAIVNYREALEINPAERKSRLALARLLADRGQFAEAESLLAEAIRAEPEWKDPYSELGKRYAAGGRWAAAAALWSAYLQRHPDDAAARAALDAARAAEAAPPK